MAGKVGICFGAWDGCWGAGYLRGRGRGDGGEGWERRRGSLRGG